MKEWKRQEKDGEKNKVILVQDSYEMHNYNEEISAVYVFTRTLDT